MSHIMVVLKFHAKWSRENVLLVIDCIFSRAKSGIFRSIAIFLVVPRDDLMTSLDSRPER